MEQYLLEKTIETWGVDKTVEIVLIALTTATFSVIVANHLIPNHPEIKNIEKEN